MPLRRRILTATFSLLYGPLVLLHEPAGRLAFGPSWPGRRRNLLGEFTPSDRVLDVGAGSGLLVAAGTAMGLDITGVDPSPAMRRLAARRGATVIAGSAQALPFPDASISALVSSYPGPWIADPETWSEFARILRRGGRVAILLGGTVERGPGASVRRALLGMLYGRAGLEAPTDFDLPAPANITGSVEIVDDDWGRAVIWRGQRR